MNLKPFFSLLSAIVLSFASAYAVPAYPGFITVTQPDGSEIRIRIIGDEYGHITVDEEGDILVESSQGWVKANPVQADSIKAKFNNRIERRKRPVLKTRAETDNQARIGLLSGANFPTIGSHHSLVILVEFQNREFIMENPQDFYTRMLNDDNFSDYGGTGSARKYLVNNSKGLFQPYFDVVGPVLLPETFQYYGANVNKYLEGVGYYVDDACPEEMVLQACEILKSEGFDFSPYDCNGDGEIDNIFLFYAGFGEADGGPTGSVWPHSGNMLEKRPDEKVFLDGLLLNHYACTNELKFTTRIPDGFGTFLHEFSHVMGFPDLYPLNGSTTVTPDNWDVMDLGCYLNESRTPPNYSTFELYAFGWLEPEEITETGNYSLPVLHSDEGKAYIIYNANKENNPNEFFLFENRQKSGQDRYLPGHGMLIWHIDFDQEIWDSNSVNNTARHPRMRIIEADNLTGHYDIVYIDGKPYLEYKYENEGDPFPGTSKNTSFGPDTTPAFRDWRNQWPGLLLFNIKESNSGLITFSVSDGSVTGLSLTSGETSHIIINGRNVRLSSGSAEVYNISGMHIATLSENPVTLVPGIYITSKKDKFIVK